MTDSLVKEKIKLTPPSPQKPRARTLFFLNHPNHPKATAWLAQVQTRLAVQAEEEYSKQLAQGGKKTLKQISSKISKEFLGREDKR